MSWRDAERIMQMIGSSGSWGSEKISEVGQMPHRSPQPLQPYPALSSQSFSRQSQRQASLPNSVSASSSPSIVSPCNSDIEHLNSSRSQIGDADQESSTS